jgi:hypothetical protein
MSNTKIRNVAALAGGMACVLAACSVDTSDVRFLPDSELDLGNKGGVLGAGGVLNKGGSKGSAGSDDVSEGGEDNTVPPGGGMPTGGSSSGGSPSGGVGGSPIASGGGGGLPPASGYPCAMRSPAPSLIADFTGVMTAMDTWGDATRSISFGLYAFPPNSPPTLKPGQGIMTVETKVGQPIGFGIWFSPCLDAAVSGFKGLAFSAAGNRGDGQALILRVAISTNETRMADPMSRTGGCVPPGGGMDVGYCRPAATEVMVPMTIDMTSEILVPFDAFRNGSPVAMLDDSQLSQLVGVEWGFIYLNGQPAYDAQLMIDNVGFR